MTDRVLEGTIIRGPEFEPVQGRVVVEEGAARTSPGDSGQPGAGEIVAVEQESVASDDVVLPAFVNAHTHLGDSIAKEAGRGLTLEELVAPPDGLKHRLLRRADRDEIVTAMARSLRFMRATGTVHCVEFREGGVEGVEAIHEAADGTGVDPIVLGRETVDAIEIADGFGASGANDADFTDERAATREAGKLFGIHAGEVDASDVGPALALEPDHLVHVVHATDEHLARVEREGIPVAVCPRSNLVTDVGFPPIEDLVERTTVALGTDNVFLNAPSMFREMEFASKLTDLEAPDVLRMATTAGAELAGLDCGVIEEGRPAKLLVLDGDSDNLAGVRDPVRAIVRRAGSSDVSAVYP